MKDRQLRNFTSFLLEYCNITAQWNLSIMVTVLAGHLLSIISRGLGPKAVFSVHFNLC